MRLKSLKIIVLLALVLAAAGFTAGSAVQAVAAQTNSTVKIYFFWGDGCPHCAAADPFLEGLTQTYSGVELLKFEVWNVPENRDLMHQMGEKYGFDPAGVPTILVGSQHWVGYSDLIGSDIEQAVKECLASGCEDAGAGLLSPAAEEPAQPQAPTQPAQESTQPQAPAQPGVEQHLISVPLLGTVNLDKQSLWVSTLLISFVDGFNPCSLWVLSMLMALTIHTGSRKKILLIGLVFLAVTAGVYALFIAGLFSVLKIIRFVGWIQALVAGMALIFAMVNIKDYFWYKEGVSFTISDENKGSIARSIRKVIASSDSLWGLIGSTVVMSAGVSLVEFSCTAGFPVIWTNLLTAQGVSALTFILLLLLYMLIYQIDELAIFLSVVFTLKTSRIEEKQGRILKLIGGMLMLTLAVVMLVNPSLMNNLTSSLLIFGIAFGAAILVLLIHRWLLPLFGISFGLESSKKSSNRRKRSAPRRR